MASTQPSASLDPRKMQAAVATLAAIREGDLSARLDRSLGGADIAEVVDHVNEVIAELENRTDELHTASMELALGLSDCFEALSQFRAGNLEARASVDTVGSPDELLGKFAGALNETLGDLEHVIERQRFAIQTLSTPVLQVWDRVLALPVIGVLDAERGNEMLEKLMAAIEEHDASYVIVDVTGVEAVDATTGDYFARLVHAAEMLGTDCYLTGIRSSVAQTFLDLGVNLSGLKKARTMRTALCRCVRQIEEESVDSGPRVTAAGLPPPPPEREED